MAQRKKAPPKRGASRYQALEKKPIPGWLWLFGGLVIGGFVVFLTKLEPGNSAIERSEKIASTTTEKTPKPSEPKAKPQRQYEFYQLLSDSKVILPPAAEQTPNTPKTLTAEQLAQQEAARAQALLDGTPLPPRPDSPQTAEKPKKTSFFLQAGAFRNAADAEQVRAQIILLGQKASVERSTTGTDTWHRVLVGPFSTRAQLQDAQKLLAAHGMTKLIVQERAVR